MAGSRRSFLAGAAVLFGASATAPLFAAQATAISNWQKNSSKWVDTAAHNFTPELFQKLVGRSFDVKDASSGSLKMKLANVSVPTKNSKGPVITGFSLHFQQTSGTWLPQGTYQLTVPELGTFPLFIVPASKAKLTTYNAIINRI